MLGKLKNLLKGDAKPEFDNEFTRLISAYAEKAEWMIDIVDEDHVVIGFEEEDGRTQNVHLLSRRAGETSVVCITSAACKVNELRGKGVDLKGLYNELLAENEDATYHSWALSGEDDDLLITANANYMLHKMDFDEFRISVGMISEVADKLEARFGSDGY